MQGSVSFGTSPGDAGAPKIRLIQPFDMPAAMRLKESANWNQTQQDWERLMKIEPEGCFGLVQDGVLAASATSLTYGNDLAWIGMVLTLPEYRKRGYGRMLMIRALEFIESRGIAKAGLDATDMGYPLYESLGFVNESVVERWERPADLEPVTGAAFERWEYDRGLDLPAFGANRSAFLESLAEQESTAIPGEAYAIGRPGSRAAYFGPCVSRSADAARQLLLWFLSRHPGELIFWDLLTDNPQAVALAQEHGFRPVRRLTRMVRNVCGTEPLKKPDYSIAYAIAGFECG
jgi:GNAT superfamily N-acetyltransferase